VPGLLLFVGGIVWFVRRCQRAAAATPPETTM
jgi:hypothetical protein